MKTLLHVVALAFSMNLFAFAPPDPLQCSVGETFTFDKFEDLLIENLIQQEFAHQTVIAKESMVLAVGTVAGTEVRDDHGKVVQLEVMYIVWVALTFADWTEKEPFSGEYALGLLLETPEEVRQFFNLHPDLQPLDLPLCDQNIG